jgi:predicted branched-subunit amino acid permease
MSALDTFSGPAARLRIVDWLAVLLAVSLPWSTSATAVLSVIWLIAVAFTLAREDGDILRTWAGGLPVLLVLLGIAGMAWADVSLTELWKGLDSFLKLLFVPLLLVHFRRSERGLCVFAGYALSCMALLLVSYGLVLLTERGGVEFGVPVKNAASQSGEFATCILGFAYLAYDWASRRKWALAAVAVALMVAMFCNMAFVATGRTALVVLLVLLVLFAMLHLTWRGIALAAAAAAVVVSVAWVSSPYLRSRTEAVWTELRTTQATGERTSSGERMEFAKRSLAFIGEAPVIGHGTGTIHGLFEKAAAGKTGVAGVAAANPHNQTLAVGIQLGLIGIAVLWAMWAAHLLLFRGGGLVAWIGVVVVVQNIVGSLFNSHLFDFLQGWTYVVGVGVAGGMMLRRRPQRGEPAA